MFGVEGWMAEEPEADLERVRIRKRVMKGLRLGSHDGKTGEDGTRMGRGARNSGEVVFFRLGEGVVGVGSLTTV